MKIINLAQRSSAWHAWRKAGVSASAAAIILGRHPDKTLWRLWAEKTGRAVEEDLSKNPHVMRGLALEDRARQCCERVLGEEFLLPVCGQSDESPFLLASFDGLTASGIPTELKCPAESTYESVVFEGEQSEAYRRHLPQVQQQLYVADASYGWLLFYSPANTGAHRIFKVARDDALIADLVARAQVFMEENVGKDKAPPLDLERDLYIPTDIAAQRWILHAMDYRIAEQRMQAMQETLDALNARKGRALEAMKQLMGDFCKAEFAGVSVTRYEQQGAIDYGKFLDENFPSVTATDLERYRKKGTGRTRVTVTHQAMPRNIVDVDVQDSLAGVEDGELKSMFF